MRVVKLHSVGTAVDTDGNTYEMERKDSGKWVNKYDVPDYDLENTVVEWYDGLNNLDLMKLTMWCIEHKIRLPYNFR
jgi:hypothetical protein